MGAVAVGVVAIPVAARKSKCVIAIPTVAVPTGPLVMPAPQQHGVPGADGFVGNGVVILWHITDFIVEHSGPLSVDLRRTILDRYEPQNHL